MMLIEESIKSTNSNVFNGFFINWYQMMRKNKKEHLMQIILSNNSCYFEQQLQIKLFRLQILS